MSRLFISCDYGFTEEILISLLSHGRKPGWWDSEADTITYDLMFKLFQCCFKVSGGMEESMKRAVTSLDKTISVKDV